MFQKRSFAMTQQDALKSNYLNHLKTLGLKVLKMQALLRLLCLQMEILWATLSELYHTFSNVLNYIILWSLLGVHITFLLAGP